MRLIFNLSNFLSMKKFTLLFLLLTLLSLGKQTVKAQAPAQCQDIMLQAFYWDSYSDSKWTNLNSKVGEIAPNFSLVWLPPSGNAQSSNNMGYAPIWWFDQNSAFGTKTELKTLIAALNANGSKAIADVVVNHRSGELSWEDFPTETYNGVTYSLGPAQICNGDEVKDQTGQTKPTGANDTGENFDGSRDLDHTSTTVRDAIKGYMQFLKNDMGYSGWRYDMTKGYSASYVNEYNTAAGNFFSVGEYFDGNYDLCKAWVNNCSNNSTTFDFPEKFALNTAMWSGGMDLTKLIWPYNGVPQPAGLIHHPDTKRYAVTFVDNHDTYRASSGSQFTGNVLAAYAFLMGSPGVPCVLLDHWNNNKPAIFAMIAARKAVKLHSESAITVNQSATNLYVATATGLNGTLIVKIGSGSYTAPAGYTLATSGTDYAIWTKTINDVAPTLSVSPSGGTYYSAQTVTLLTTSGASVYYTTDNTAPTNASSKYSVPVVISGTQTLRAIAYNATTQLYSAEASNTYNISSVPASIKVRFKVPVGWTACKVYSWVGNTTLTTTWPGNAMTLDADGYYSYSVTGFTTLPIGIVFNNGVGSSPPQTVDLNASADMCWDAAGLSGSKYTATEVSCSAITAVEDMPAQVPLKVYSASGKFFISGAADKSGIVVRNMVGQVVLRNSVKGEGLQTVNSGNLPSGLYTVSVTSEGMTRSQKIVIR